MKVKLFLMIGLLFRGSALIVGCRKEVRIEKNLWKNGGEWNVVTHEYASVSSSGISNIAISLQDLGTMTFNQDGNGTYSLIRGGSVNTGTLQYTNSEDQMSLTLNNSTTPYQMYWKKDEITLLYRVTISSDRQTFTISETYKLKKK